LNTVPPTVKGRELPVIDDLEADDVEAPESRRLVSGSAAVAREAFLLGNARADPQTASVAVMPFEFLDDEPPQLKPIRRRPATAAGGRSAPAPAVRSSRGRGGARRGLTRICRAGTCRSA
jgi:hypothetical protein